MVLKFRYDSSLDMQNLQKRIKKKKKGQNRERELPAPMAFVSLQKEYHSQTLFSGSSRGTSSDKATGEHPSHIEQSDFLNARWRPAISLQ